MANNSGLSGKRKTRPYNVLRKALGERIADEARKYQGKMLRDGVKLSYEDCHTRVVRGQT